MGWSQWELADRLGTTQARVSEWERGRSRPELHHIVRISHIMTIILRVEIGGLTVCIGPLPLLSVPGAV
jgi:transcriptional regulator with XRE-family HTH domain